MLQKATFWRAKDGILEAESIPFRNRKVAFWLSRVRPDVRHGQPAPRQWRYVAQSAALQMLSVTYGEVRRLQSDVLSHNVAFF